MTKHESNQHPETSWWCGCFRGRLPVLRVALIWIWTYIICNPVTALVPLQLPQHGSSSLWVAKRSQSYNAINYHASCLPLRLLVVEDPHRPAAKQRLRSSLTHLCTAPRSNEFEKQTAADLEIIGDIPHTTIASEQGATTTPASTTLTDAPLCLDFISDEQNLAKGLSSRVTYFYLRHEVGLSEDILWKITHDAPAVLGFSADNVRHKVDVLQQGMDLSQDDVKVLIERLPALLHLSADENVVPKMKWLTTTLQLKSKQELRHLILCRPSILDYAPANLQQKVQFFTSSKGMGFSTDECRSLFLEEPRLLTCGVKTGLLPRARFYLSELKMPKDELRAAVLKKPQLLMHSVADTLTPKLINYAIMMLHMDKSSIVKLLTTYPQFLDYNLDGTILPLTRYFLNELGFSSHEFRVILLKCPRIITHSLTKKIKRAAGYLRYEIGLDADGVKRVLYQAPTILGLDVDQNLRPKVEFLQEFLTGDMHNNSNNNTSKGMGMTEEQHQVLRQVIAAMPTILQLSVETNLRPKLEYLQKMLQADVDNSHIDGPEKQLLRETILQLPALLGYSLKKRIQPRMEQIIDAGLAPSNIKIGICMTNENFLTWLQGRQKKKAKRALVYIGGGGTQIVRPSSSSSMSSQSKGEDTDRSARIVHWSRERKQ